MNTMKTNLVLVLAISLVLVFTDVSFGQEFFVKDGVGATEGPKCTPGEIIVKFERGVSKDVIQQLNQHHETSVLSISRRGEFIRLRIPKNRTVEGMVAIYSRNPNVEYAEPNYMAHAFLVPNDSYYPYQWHMDNGGTGGTGRNGDVVQNKQLRTNVGGGWGTLVNREAHPIKAVRVRHVSYPGKRPWMENVLLTRPLGTSGTPFTFIVFK